MEIAIITGASSGMGKDFARKLTLKYNFDEVWLNARNEQRLKEVADGLNVKTRLFVGDLTDKQTTDNIINALKETNATVKVLVNGAGYGVMNSVMNSTYEESVGMIDLNVRALFTLTYFALPYCVKGSQIINIGSFSSFEPLPYMSIYAASKSFVLSFTRSLNRELKQSGIHAIGFCPMWVETEFIDKANKNKLIRRFKPLYKSEFVVDKCIKALDTKKDYVVPGFRAKIYCFLVKIFPHSVVMSAFLKQQKIK